MKEELNALTLINQRLEVTMLEWGRFLMDNFAVVFCVILVFIVIGNILIGIYIYKNDGARGLRRWLFYS